MQIVLLLFSIVAFGSAQDDRQEASKADEGHSLECGDPQFNGEYMGTFLLGTKLIIPRYKNSSYRFNQNKPSHSANKA